jgi:hypothetical protein
VSALLVVEHLDPLEDGLGQLLARRRVVAVQELGLDGGEEAFGHGVVQCVDDELIEASLNVVCVAPPKTRDRSPW